MPGLVDKACGRFVGRVGAVPQFGPAENRQRRPRQASATGLGQVELAAAVLVRFMACGAEVQGHGDMAVERDQPILQFIGLLDHFQRVAGIAAKPVIPGKACAGSNGQGQGQADV